MIQELRERGLGLEASILWSLSLLNVFFLLSGFLTGTSISSTRKILVGKMHPGSIAGGWMS